MNHKIKEGENTSLKNRIVSGMMLIGILGVIMEPMLVCLFLFQKTSLNGFVASNCVLSWIAFIFGFLFFGDD